MILHVIKSNIYSGAENVVCQIIQGMNHSEKCIYMSPHGPIEAKLKELGLYDCYYGIDSLTVSSIKEAVAKLNPDVVHAHDFTASVLCALALKGSVPTISHLHNNPPWIQNKNLRTISYLYATRYFSQILVVSDAVKKEFCYTSRLTTPMSVVGNPFSVSGVQSHITDAPASDLLFVGRITEQKDPLLVLQIAKALHEDSQFISRYGELNLRMVGDGDMAPACRNYIEKNNMSSYVFMEGFKENSHSYMASAKVLLMPSKWEGFGLVALEAMALSKPVVSSGNGGLANIIDNTCGFKCSSFDEYVTAIKELLLNNELYQEKSRGALTRANKFDTIDDYIENLKSAYDASLNTSQPLVMHVFRSNIYSGAENVACQIITELKDSRRFLYLSPHGTIEHKLADLGLLWFYKGLPKLNFFNVRRCISKEQPAILHAHDFTASIICALATRGRVPVVSHLHQNPPWLKSKNLRSLSFLFVSRWLAQIVVVSDSVCKDYVYISKLKCPVQVIGNPFSIEKLSIYKNSTPSKAIEACDIVFLGRLVDAKDPLHALDIFRQYRQSYNQGSFRIIGDGELIDKCKEYIELHNLEQFVILEGNCDNPYKYMANSKLLLMPSKWEGFGLAALEAMALGLPVVCSGCGGLSTIIDDTCGYICHTDKEYVDSIHSLLTSTVAYDAKSKGAVSRAQSFDNLSDYINSIECIYSKLV